MAITRLERKKRKLRMRTRMRKQKLVILNDVSVKNLVNTDDVPSDIAKGVALREKLAKAEAKASE